MATKVLVAFDSYYQDKNSLKQMLTTAARTADRELQITCFSETRELVDALRMAVDDVTVILSQTFAGYRFEKDALEQFRRLSPHGNVRIILIINRPREEVSDEELMSFIRSGFFDLYFLSDVDNAKKLIATTWATRGADEAYRYLRLTPPTEVRATEKIPYREFLEGADNDKKNKRRGKNFSFEPPLARSRVPVSRRRTVVVCSCMSGVGASRLAMNLALAIAAGGKRVAYQELPPEQGYFVEKLVGREIVKPVQHAATLYQTGKVIPGENKYRGVSWYYELSDGVAISRDRVDTEFLIKYLTMPKEDIPAIVDAGSAFHRLIESDEVAEMITDVVIAVRSEKLKDEAISRMERLLAAVSGIGIRPIIVCLNEDPPRKPANLWRDYAALLYYINPSRTDERGIYQGGEEELSAVISALGLYDASVPEAPQPSEPVQMEMVSVPEQNDETEIVYDDIVEEQPRPFVPIFNKPFPKKVPVGTPSEDGNSIADNASYTVKEPSVITVEPEEVKVVDAPAPEPVKEEPVKEEKPAVDNSWMQGRITELAMANNELVAKLNDANASIEKQNAYIRESCVARNDYQNLYNEYEKLRGQYEALTHSSEAAGRDREALSTAAADAEAESKRLAEQLAGLTNQMNQMSASLNEKDNVIASLQESVKGKDEMLNNLRSGSSTAASALADMTRERDEYRGKVASLEQEQARSKSIIESRGGEIESLRVEVSNLRTAVADAQASAVAQRKEYEQEYERRYQALNNTVEAVKAEASGDRTKLMKQLEEAQAERNAFEASRDAILNQARAEAERIRKDAQADIERKTEEARAYVDAEHQAVLRKQEEVEKLRAEASNQRAVAAVEAEKILAKANEDAEAKRAEASNAYADKEKELRLKEQMFQSHMESEEKRVREEEVAVAERSEELENRENDLKLLESMLEKQKKQQDQKEKTLAADLADLESQKKDFVRRVKELSSQEEDVKDREARRAEKERRAIAKAEERADLHRLKMEERRKGGANGVTFFICLLIISIVFGGMLYLIYKQGKDETGKLRNQIAQSEAQMVTVLVAKDDLPKDTIVTMSDFIVTEIRLDEAGDTEGKYVASFSGTLTLTNGLSKGQCLTTGDFTKE